MRRLALAALLVTPLLAGNGCAIQSAVGGGRYVSPDLADDCVSQCDVVQMRLAAVVIVASTAGCVCEPADRPASTSRGGAAAAGGAVVEVMRQRSAAAGAAAATAAAHH